MKIALHITINIDRDTWAEEYGVDPANVREDVREYVTHMLWEMPVRPTDVTTR